MKTREPEIFEEPRCARKQTDDINNLLKTWESQNLSE